MTVLSGRRALAEFSGTHTVVVDNTSRRVEMCTVTIRCRRALYASRRRRGYETDTAITRDGVREEK